MSRLSILATIGLAEKYRYTGVRGVESWMLGEALTLILPSEFQLQRNVRRKYSSLELISLIHKHTWSFDLRYHDEENDSS